jgi:type I restriction enzyme S subunit
MTELPRGWANAALDELAATSLGKMLDAKQQTGAHPTPYLRNINVRWGSFDVSDVAVMDVAPHELERVLAVDGDVIACEGGEPGRSAVWKGEPIALQKALHRIRPAEGVSAEYVALGLRAQASTGELARLFTGTTIKHLPQEKLRLVRVPLAPEREQERIVAAIEEAFSKLDAGQAGLQMVRKLLKRMRAAVVASAVAGRLVRQDATDTPATKLLAELGVSPMVPTDVRSLPDGWAFVRVSDVLQRIEAGKSFATLGRPAGEGEVGVIKVSAMTWGEFRPDENKAIPLKSEIDERWVIRGGDLLFSRANTSEYVGASVVVPRDYPSLILSDKSLRLVPVAGVSAEWLLLALRARPAREQIERHATGTKESMRNISQAKLRSVEITLPPVEEQARIVAEVDRQMSFVLACERAVDDGLARSAALRRSVLKAAFEGRLVPQDPTDEPASVLLERIRDERSAASKAKSRRVGAKA